MSVSQVFSLYMFALNLTTEYIALRNISMWFMKRIVCLIRVHIVHRTFFTFPIVLAAIIAVYIVVVIARKIDAIRC